MNRQLLELLEQRSDYPIPIEDRKLVEWFVEYLDHSSLWLLRWEQSDSGEPVFIFTNEAQRFRFSVSEMKAHYASMKSGVAMDWESIPFEYISKS